MDGTEKPRTRVRSVLEDPSALAVARVYAESFLNAAAAAGVDEALEEFTSFVDDVLATHTDFESMLYSGIVGRDEKIAMIDHVVGPFGSALFTNFLKVLARHDRLELLPLILNETTLRHEQRIGQARVQISSPAELSRETLEKIGQQIRESRAFEPILQTRVDPSLLGGIVIRIGDTVYDSSLRTRMKQLREQLRQRSLHEIQVGRDRFSHPKGD